MSYRSVHMIESGHRTAIKLGLVGWSSLAPGSPHVKNKEKELSYFLFIVRMDVKLRRRVIFITKTNQLKSCDLLGTDYCTDVFLSIAGSEEAKIFLWFWRGCLPWRGSGRLLSLLWLRMGLSTTTVCQINNMHTHMIFAWGRDTHNLWGWSLHFFIVRKIEPEFLVCWKSLVTPDKNWWVKVTKNSLIT